MFEPANRLPDQHGSDDQPGHLTRGLVPQRIETPISFTVYEENAVSYGLDYSGVVSTPESGTLALLGSGLLGIFMMTRRTVLS